MNMAQFLHDFKESLESKGIKATLKVVSDINIPRDCPPKPEHLMNKSVSHKTAYVHRVVDSPIYSNSRYKGD